MRGDQGIEKTAGIETDEKEGDIQQGRVINIFTPTLMNAAFGNILVAMHTVLQLHMWQIYTKWFDA